MTADLAAFLRAREDEREQRARTVMAELEPAVDHRPRKRSACCGEALSEEGLCMSCTYFGDEGDDRAAGYDPAWVLADVEAKRRILDLHPMNTQQPYRAARGMFYPPDPFYCDCQVDDGIIYDNEPCATKRLLALPYAGHEDYKSEWAPE